MSNLPRRRVSLQSLKVFSFVESVGTEYDAQFIAMEIEKPFDFKHGVHVEVDINSPYGMDF